MQKILVIALVFIFVSCSSKQYEFWDIEKFNLKEDALLNNEEIKLLYSSRSPDNNNEPSYYIHLIVVSQKSGDTVNVLTTIDNGFNEEDGDKVFNFFDKDSYATKLFRTPDRIMEIPDVTKQNDKILSKVARDPEFDFIADNNYPTVIGTVGKIIKE